MPKILELSSRASKGGRRKIRMALLTIHGENECNRNGIHWSEQYVLDNLESIKGMPICCSFLDEGKIIPFDHGYTETVEIESGKLEPLFENSESVGVIEDAKIEDIELDGEKKRVLVGYGYLFYQRYKGFCDYLRTTLTDSSVKSSIEIMAVDNTSIVYDGGYNEDYRIPQIFDFSATAILSVKEADENAYVLEVAQKDDKEENPKMSEKEIMEIVQKAIGEMNSSKAEMDIKIAELNSMIEAKDAEIQELNEAKADAEKEAGEKEKKIKDLEGEKENLSDEVNKCKEKELNSDLDKKLESYTAEEKKYAESEINSFKENPLGGNIDSIVLRINAGIGAKAKADAEAKITEQNAAKKETVDIFAEVNSAEEEDEADINIF